MIVRRDLPVGLLAAEVVHAAGESAALRAPPPGAHAVVLAADAAELVRLEALLRRESYLVAAITDDVDTPNQETLVALGIAPCSEGVQRWLRHLPLVGKEPSAS